MNNEEIREEIKKYQKKIQESLAKNQTFELNPEIIKYKHQIDKLREKCSHLNPNHEVQTFNGRCIYCGARIER